ncbi:MAG TPA: GAF domain-containing protein, partial [Anaerolineales bacterium]
MPQKAPNTKPGLSSGLNDRLESLFAELEQAQRVPLDETPAIEAPSLWQAGEISTPQADPLAPEAFPSWLAENLASGDLLPAPVKGNGHLPPSPEPQAVELWPTPDPQPALPLPPASPSGTQGYRAEGEHTLPVQLVQAALGLQDLPERPVSAQEVAHGQPAVLAHALTLQEQNSKLLLEVLDDDPQRQWSQDERQLVKQVADQLSLALENAWLFQSTQALLEETERLYNASRRLSTAANLNDVVRAVAEGASIPQISRAILITLEQDAAGKGRSFVFSANWWSGQGVRLGIPLGTRFTQEQLPALHLALGKEPLFVDNVLEDERLDPASREALLQQEARCVALLPLWAGGGPISTGELRQPGRVFTEHRERQLGSLMLVGDQPHHFTDGEIRPFRSLAGQMATVIENRNLFEQTQVNLAETEAMYQASAELNAAHTYTAVLDTLRKHTLLGQVDRDSSLYLFDRPWNDSDLPEECQVLACWGSLPGESAGAGFSFSAFPAARQVLSPYEATTIEDVLRDSRLDEVSRGWYARRFRAASAVFLPLVVAGQWIGFASANFSAPAHFEEALLRRALALAGQAAVAVQNLHNIDLAEQRAHEAQQRSEQLAVVNRVVSTVAALATTSSSASAANMAAIPPRSSSATTSASTTSPARH